ncbi:MAG: low-specificity L-threonine aldolase [Myxococcaceae bacterium]|jgi:threonine aldolase|nr:low-specificity L-threonine aldolase [Myxococcaceae bacterium]
MTPIDLRSDTVTRPTAGMRRAMAEAEVGDDVWGDDPTVQRLEAVLAERLGFEAGLFLPSGTQSNLAALLTHCARGDEVLLGDRSHTFVHEGGGAAALGSIHSHPLPNQADGSLRAADVEAAIKPDDAHFAKSRLLCLENTIEGQVVPQALVEAACRVARARGLATHLDGARLFNAAVKSRCAPAGLTRPFDSVSVCLSKGLGAPVGSVLVGARDFVRAARRWRKVLGGGMRQVGVLAAAGLFALEHHVERLEDDHLNAALLAERLSGVPGLEPEPVQTNMVWVRVSSTLAPRFVERLAEGGVLASGAERLRFVTHLDVSRDDIERAARVVRAVATGRA